MKAIEIKDVLKNDLLLVELPEQHTANTYADKISICNEINNPIHFIEGSYTLLGKPDEIREDDARELVQKISFGFKNYKSKDIEFFLHAKQSLLSLLESDVYWVNPFKKLDNYNLWAKYGDYTQYGVGLTTESLKWHEAEQKTFDRNRTLIFVKK